jgi:septal ring factor EnvC (AmiA/AmiB activator)
MRVSPGRRPCVTATAGFAAFIAFGAAPAFAALQNAPRPEPIDRRIATRIRALEDDADRIAAEARTVVESIRTLEGERDRRIAEADRAAREARATELELSLARQRLDKLRQAEAMDEPLIAARLVQVYKQGHGGYIRLLLGAETLQDIGRAARTISSLIDQNAARVTARLEDMALAKRVEEELAGRLVALHDAGLQAQEASVTAAAAIAEREATAAQLDRRRDANAEMLSELRASLTGTTPATAAPAVIAAVVPPGLRAPFSAFKGALDWPVVGPVTTRFASGRRQASALANGVTIAAPPGTPVVAVHAGIVTYAEPLAGFGTMVMLDHGGGYSSGYGLLRSTPARRDQRVAEGEQIGVVGDTPVTGTRTALYFEVRASGRPADPLQWLRPR